MEVQSKLKSCKRAFTLIELLIVVAIIGVLAGAILINASGAKTKAADNAAMQSVQSIVPAFSSCLFSGSAMGTAYGENPVEGSSICGGNEKWPTFAGSSWSIINVYFDAAYSFYWIRAWDSKGGKFYICDYSPVGWTTDGVDGNNAAKCTKSNGGGPIANF